VLTFIIHRQINKSRDKLTNN